MSRASKALKRLGVPGLAAVTIFAGFPAIMATTASAAQGDTVTITPERDSASVGTCNPFTITVRNSSGGPATSTVDVNIAERTPTGAAATDTFDVEFCTVPTNGVTPQAPADERETESTTGNDTDHAEFTVASDGTVVFGVMSVPSDQPGSPPATTGTADIVAFIDDATSTSPAVTANDDTAQSTEAQDTAIKDFTPGGSANGSSDTPTGAGTANDLVASLDAEPETQTAFTNETVQILVTVRNQQGDTLVGVRPAGDVTEGPNNAKAVSCTASNNDGVSTCTYQPTATGSDTVVIFVNERDADANTNTPSTNGLDAGESSDAVTVNVQTAPSGLTVVLTCGDTSTPRTAADACRNPLSDTTEVFTATVTGPDGNDAGTAPDPASGVVINFTQSTTANGDTTGTETLNPTSATTDANGVATTTLTNTNTAEGETVTVTATIRGQAAGTGTTDTATKVWRTAAASEARNIVLTPESATTTANTFREFSARVTNQFGEVVPGVDVTFTEGGAGAFRNGSSSIVVRTDASGVARAEVTSAPGEFGTQTITATISTTGTQCGNAAGNPSGSTAGNCSDTSTNNFVSGQAPTTGPPSPTTPPGCDVARSNLPFTINDQDKTVKATAPVTVTVRGARAGEVVELQAYQQNHFGTANFSNAANTRTAVADANGAATFTLRFSSNARIRAKVQGCSFGPNAGFNNAGGNVLFVSVALFLNVERVGARTYVISGDSIPARPGGLIVNIYCTDNRCKTPRNPSGILTQPRANATNGEYRSARVTFPASFQGTRVNILALLRGDAQNVAGQSNVRSLLIG